MKRLRTTGSNHNYAPRTEYYQKMMKIILSALKNIDTIKIQKLNLDEYPLQHDKLRIMTILTTQSAKQGRVAYSP